MSLQKGDRSLPTPTYTVDTTDWKKKKRKGWTLWMEEEAGDIKRIKVKMKINSWKQTKAWENAKSFQG